MSDKKILINNFNKTERAKGIQPAEFDFVDIDKRLKELKLLEKKLLAELKIN